MVNRDEVIANCRLAQKVLSDCSEIDAKLTDHHREIDRIAKLSRKAIQENARIALSQDEFNKQINGYQERHRLVLDQINELESQKRERVNKGVEIDRFINELASRPLVIDEFDERLWLAAVEQVTVGVD